jgi:peptide/nickel transport system substrate-binding protein
MEISISTFCKILVSRLQNKLFVSFYIVFLFSIGALLSVSLTGCMENGVDSVTTFYSAGVWRNPPAFNGNPWTENGRGAHESYIYEPLFLYTPSNEKFIPRLGLSFTESSDKTKLTVNLRKDAFWHDGSPFTSKDVQSTFMVWYLQNWGDNLAGIDLEVAPGSFHLPVKHDTGDKKVDENTDGLTIQTPDDYTVIFRWFRPCSDVDKIQLLTEPIKLSWKLYHSWADKAHPFIQQISKINALKKTQKLSYEEFTEKALKIREEILRGKSEIRKSLYKFKPQLPVGTGPFKLVTVTPTDMILERFDKSWCRDKLSVEKVHLLKWPGDQAIWAYLIAGQVDAVAPATPPDVAEQILKKNPKLKLITPDEYAEFGFIFNLRRYPMSDLRFRKAIAYGVDRDLIRKISYFYAQTVDQYSHGVVKSLENRWLNKNTLEGMTKYSYDPEMAGKLLLSMGVKYDSSGYMVNKSGDRLNIEIATQAGCTDWTLGAESLASQLTNLGISAKVRMFEGSIYASQLRAGNFDIAVQFGTDYRRYAHPAPSFTRYFSDTGFIRLASDFPKSVKTKDGKTINLEDEIRILNVTRNPDKVKEIVALLATVANEQLPFLTVYEKRLMIFAMDGKNVSGWPDISDPVWSAGSAGLEKIYTYLMSEGILHATKTAVPEDHSSPKATTRTDQGAADQPQQAVKGGTND